jgi:hypothetical protein
VHEGPDQRHPLAHAARQLPRVLAHRLLEPQLRAKRLEIVNGSEHGTELLEGGQAEVVRRLILDFLATLGP